MIAEPKCSQRKCVHFQGVYQPNDDESVELPCCAAFPEGIPDAVAWGKNKHDVPIEGDHGILYSPDPDHLPRDVEQGTPTHKLRKVKVRHIKPLPRDTAETKRAQQKMERALKRVLHALKKEVVPQIKANLTRLLKASPKKVSLDAVATVTMKGLDAIVTDTVIQNYKDVVHDAALSAFASIGAPDRDGIVEQLNERSQAWADDRAAELVGMKWNENDELVDNPNAEWAIDESTRDMLRETIASGMSEGMGVDELTDAIEEGYAFSEGRARMIARTEISYAHNSGARQGYQAAKDIGVNVKKEWILGPAPCDVCIDNNDDGAIDIDELFTSGDDAPPAHPNCECALAPVVEGDEGYEEDDEEDVDE